VPSGTDIAADSENARARIEADTAVVEVEVVMAPNEAVAATEVAVAIVENRDCAAVEASLSAIVA
jgi:hypothetical protein